MQLVHVAILIHPYISTPSLIVFIIFFIMSQFKVENVIVSKVVTCKYIKCTIIQINYVFFNGSIILEYLMLPLSRIWILSR